jgi:L-amino acid N-acyltransferase YncA
MQARIRSVAVSDAEAIREIYAPFVSEDATSFEILVPNVDEVERRIQMQRDRYPWLVFERDARVLGYAYASAHRSRPACQWCVEVSVYVDSQAHRRGVGRALYEALFELLRRQGFVNAYAGITLPNAASIGLHESLGFVSVGIFRRIGFKFDRWHDVAWLHLRLAEAPRPLQGPLLPGSLWPEPSVMRMLGSCAQSARLD